MFDDFEIVYKILDEGAPMPIKETVHESFKTIPEVEKRVKTLLDDGVLIGDMKIYKRQSVKLKYEIEWLRKID